MRLPKLSPRTIKGVLFDLDGTCVDSEFLSPLVWAAVLKEIPGIDTSSMDHKAMEAALTDPKLRGANALDVGNHLLKTFDIQYNDDPAILVKRKRALAVEMVVDGHVDLEPLWFKGLTGRIRQFEQALGPGNVGLCAHQICIPLLKPLLKREIWVIHSMVVELVKRMLYVPIVACPASNLILLYMYLLSRNSICHQSL